MDAVYVLPFARVEFPFGTPLSFDADGLALTATKPDVGEFEPRWSFSFPSVDDDFAVSSTPEASASLLLTMAFFRAVRRCFSCLALADTVFMRQSTRKSIAEVTYPGLQAE